MGADWKKYLETAAGVTAVPRRRAEQLVKSLVSRGEVAASSGEQLVEGLLVRVERNRKAITGIVASELEAAVARMGLARQSDVQRLEQRLARLEAGQAPAAASRPPKKSAAEKRAAQRQAAADGDGDGDGEDGQASPATAAEPS